MVQVKFWLLALISVAFFVSVGAYFTASSSYGFEAQQLQQIKSLMWIAITVYIAGQFK